LESDHFIKLSTMAKNLKPLISPEIPYPGKRPDTIPDTGDEELQLPEDDPDIIIDPETEEETEPAFIPPPPGEGP